MIRALARDAQGVWRIMAHSFRYACPTAQILALPRRRVVVTCLVRKQAPGRKA